MDLVVSSICSELALVSGEVAEFTLCLLGTSVLFKFTVSGYYLGLLTLFSGQLYLLFISFPMAILYFHCVYRFCQCMGMIGSAAMAHERMASLIRYLGGFFGWCRYADSGEASNIWWMTVGSFGNSWYKFPFWACLLRMFSFSIHVNNYILWPPDSLNFWVGGWWF